MSERSKARLIVAIFFPLLLVTFGGALLLISSAVPPEAEAAISVGSSILELAPAQQQQAPTCEQIRKAKGQAEQMIAGNQRYLSALKEIFQEISATPQHPGRPSQLEAMSFIIGAMQESIKFGRGALIKIEKDEKLYCPQ